MSIKKPYESWHRADISSHSRPLKPHSWARELPDSPHLIPFFFFSPPLSDFCSPSPSSLSVSYSPPALSFSPSSFFFFLLFYSPVFLFAIPLHSSASALLTRYNSLSLPLPIQDLEEELELDRRRVSEAEGVAKRAEEELMVAKERLLLQEDELQSRAGSPSVVSPVGRRNAHIGGNQLSSVHFHSDSALIKFSPHAIIIYTGNATLFIHHKGKQFHQSVIIPSQQKRLEFYLLQENNFCFRRFLAHCRPTVSPFCLYYA